MWAITLIILIPGCVMFYTVATLFKVTDTLDFIHVCLLNSFVKFPHQVVQI